MKVAVEVKPTKWQVRQWLAERRADRARPPPAPKQLRQQLGWRLDAVATPNRKAEPVLRAAHHQTDEETS